MRTIKNLLYAVTLSSFVWSCSDDEAPTELTFNAQSETYFTEGMDFETSGGEQSFAFSTNKDWSISVVSPEGNSDWCVVTPMQGSAGEHTVKVKASANTTDAQRTATVSLIVQEISKEFVIRQEQKDAIRVDKELFELGADGGTISIKVTANVAYGGRISDSWITFKEENDLGDATEIVWSIDKHTGYEKREGKITFRSLYDEQVNATVRIIQEGTAILVVPQKEYKVSGAGGEVEIDVQSNFECKVKMPDVDWISSSSKAFTYVVSPNLTSESRKAEIVFYDEKEMAKETVTIVQDVADLILNEESVTLLVGEQKQVTYNLNPNLDNKSLVWSSSNESVVTVSQEGMITAISKGTARITVTANNGATATCEVVVKEFTDYITAEIRSASISSMSGGFITATVATYLTNDSPYDIQLKEINVIPTSSGITYSSSLSNETLKSGQSIGYEIPIPNVYKPIVRWVYTYNGKEYHADAISTYW